MVSSSLSIALLLLCIAASSSFFVVPASPFLPRSPGLLAKKPKGFGSPSSSTPPSSSPPSTSSPLPSSDPVGTTAPDRRSSPVNTGSVRLAELESRRASEAASTISSAASLLEEDSVAQSGGGVIPSTVANKMTNRMAGFVGVPFFGGVGLFCWFYYQAKVEGVRYEPMLVATATVGTLMIGLLGITYSLFSADWDGGESKGLGGVQTFNENLDRVKEGVGRGRANAKKRDVIERAGGVEEVNRIRAEALKKEEAVKKREMTLKEKMEREME